MSELLDSILKADNCMVEDKKKEFSAEKYYDDFHMDVDDDLESLQLDEIKERKRLIEKDYEIPEIGDMVEVKLSGRCTEKYIVLLIDTDIENGNCIITGVLYNKGLKSLTNFNICFVTKLIRGDNDKYSDWNIHKKMMAESLIPKIGKTAVIRRDSTLRMLSNWDTNVIKKYGTDKFKVIGIKDRKLMEPLLIVKPTKHFNQKYLEISAGHFYYS